MLVRPHKYWCLCIQVIYTFVCLNVTIDEAYPNHFIYYRIISHVAQIVSIGRSVNMYNVHSGIFNKNVVLVSSQTYHTMSGRRSKTFGCGCLRVLNGDRTTVHASISSVDSSIGCDAVFSSGFFIMFRSIESEI